jgi:hypothetical protein
LGMCDVRKIALAKFLLINVAIDIDAIISRISVRW